MNTPLKILVIEDSTSDYLLLERFLRQQDFAAEFTRVCNKAELDAALSEKWDVVLSDYSVPGMDFHATLQQIHVQWPDLPVIIVSGSLTEEMAADLLRQGPTDFLLKGHLARLPAAIRNALEESNERTARRAAEAAVWRSQEDALEEQRKARLASLNLMEDAIAAREQAERSNAALRESESKYRLVSDNASDFIFWLGTDERYIYVSPACERIFGHAPEAFLTDPELMTKLLHQDDRETYRQHLADSAHADKADLEFRFLGKDGELRWLSHKCQPMYDENGKHIGRWGSNRDITVRKQAEMQRDLFSEALRQSAHPLLLADAEFHITYINPAFSNLFGYQLEKLVRKHVSLIVPANGKYPSERDEIIIHLQESGNWSGEVDRLASDGSLIPTIATIASIRGESGRPVGYVASYLDLRPLREKDLTLRKLSLAVEQSPESIYITDLNGNIEYVNESFVRNTGYGFNEIIGRNPRILHSGKTPRSTYEDLWQNLLAGNTWQGEFYNKRKDGSEYTEHAIISPIRQPGGRITHYVSV